MRGRSMKRSRLSNMAAFALLAACLVACDSAEDKELKRLQLEKIRLETALQAQRLVSEKAKSEQEDRTRLAQAKAEEDRINRERDAQAALQKAEAERLERERLDRIREQQAQEMRERTERANQYVRSRAESRVAKIASVLLGADPSVSVSAHDCSQSGGPFNATIKVFYKGGISGDSLSVSGKLIRKSDGTEAFRFDPPSPDIIGRLSMIGMPKDKIELLVNGNAWLEFD